MSSLDENADDNGLSVVIEVQSLDKCSHIYHKTCIRKYF